MIFVAVLAVLLLLRGSRVTLVTAALLWMVPWLALMVTLIWMRQAAPALSVPRRQRTLALRCRRPGGSMSRWQSWPCGTRSRKAGGR
jgi:hypothetical protein